MGVPVLVQRKPIWLVSMRMQIPSLGSIPGLAQWVGDLVLLWLWCRPAAVAPIRPLAWEIPYATGAPLNKTKRNFFFFFCSVSATPMEQRWLKMTHAKSGVLEKEADARLGATTQWETLREGAWMPAEAGMEGPGYSFRPLAAAPKGGARFLDSSLPV